MSKTPPPLDAEGVLTGGLKGSIQGAASLGPKPAECFVAMWFGSDSESKSQMDQLFEMVIAPAIRQHGLEPYHVGRDHGADRLDVEILTAIDRSVLVVADLTHNPKKGLRGSVIFEAGYAYKTKPVVWMCREDIANTPNIIPFDIQQFRQIRWSINRIKEAKIELVKVIGRRFLTRQRDRSSHEISHVITNTWHEMTRMEDIDGAGRPFVSKDLLRFSRFRELCEDILTRVKYKPMGLSDDEKYELIELIRGFKKWMTLVRSTHDDRVFSTAIYNDTILSRLNASGWIAESAYPMSD